MRRALSWRCLLCEKKRYAYDLLQGQPVCQGIISLRLAQTSEPSEPPALQGWLCKTQSEHNRPGWPSISPKSNAGSDLDVCRVRTGARHAVILLLSYISFLMSMAHQHCLALPVPRGPVGPLHGTSYWCSHVHKQPTWRERSGGCFSCVSSFESDHAPMGGPKCNRLFRSQKACGILHHRFVGISGVEDALPQGLPRCGNCSHSLGLVWSNAEAPMSYHDYRLLKPSVMEWVSVLLVLPPGM